jgi:hypothetical protein
MNRRILLAFAFGWVFIIPKKDMPPTQACCPAPPSGKPVVNADQTVIIIWDAAKKIQHFIRKATFKSDADDFGFLVPSPSQPELNESGNETFPYLFKLTEPEKKKMPRPDQGMGCSCNKSKGGKSRGESKKGWEPPPVRILEEKEVAGFKAVVLETKSGNALVNWLKENGYAFSPAVENWAKPYVEAGWKITALKIAKDKEGKGQRVAAAALRMTFKTDQPLFPYREPDSKSAAELLEAKERLLRIYFFGEARYQGELTKEVPWTGKAAWANKLTPETREKVLELLKLPKTTGPAEWWLTEFEDNWPYQAAPADITFSRDSNQTGLHRPPIIEYVSSPWPPDITVLAIAAAVILPPIYRRLRRYPLHTGSKRDT